LQGWQPFGLWSLHHNVRESGVEGRTKCEARLLRPEGGSWSILSRPLTRTRVDAPIQW
jgi:hypothetical protein